MRNLFTYFRGLIPLIALLFMLPATMWGASATLTITASTVQSSDAITGNSWGSSYMDHRWVTTTSDQSAKIYCGGKLGKQSSTIAFKNDAGHMIGNIDPSFDASASWKNKIPSDAVGAIPGAITKIEVTGYNSRSCILYVGTSQLVTSGSSVSGAGASDTYTTQNFSKDYTADKGYCYFAIKGNNSSYRGITQIVITYEVGGNTDPSISASDKSVSYEAQSGVSFSYTISNTVEGGKVSVSKVSGDFISNVALGDNNTVTFDVAANDDPANSRNGVIRLTYTYTGGSITKDVTITQGKYVQDYVTLPYTMTEGATSFNDVDGVTSSGTTTYSDDAKYNLKFDTEGDFVNVKTDSPIGGVSIDYKMTGGSNTSKFIIKESTDGEEWSTVEELTISGSQNSTGTVATTSTFNSKSRYVQLYFNKGSNVGVKTFTVSRPSTSWRVSYKYNDKVTADAYDDVPFADCAAYVLKVAPVSPSEYITFSGWSDGATIYEAGANYEPTDNVTFNAVWEFTNQATAYTKATAATMIIGGTYVWQAQKSDDTKYVATAMGENTYLGAEVFGTYSSLSGNTLTLTSETPQSFIFSLAEDGWLIEDAANTGNYLREIGENKLKWNEEKSVWTMNGEGSDVPSFTNNFDGTEYTMYANLGSTRFNAYTSKGTNADAVLYHLASESAHTLSLVIDGETTNTYTVKDGYSWVLPTPQRYGFIFQGWATEAEGAVVYADGASYTMPAEAKSLYAVWEAQTIRPSFTVDLNDAEPYQHMKGNSTVVKLTIEADHADTYQWYEAVSATSYEGATLITGEEGESYTCSNTVIGTKYFFCTLTNAVGSVNSKIATVNTVGSNLCKLSHVEFSNGFDAFIKDNTITAYYLEGTDVPTIVESSIKVSDNATKVIEGSTLTVTAEDGATQAAYTIVLSEVTPLTASTDGEATFDGNEEWIKTGYKWDDTKGWMFSRNLSGDDDSRMVDGRNRLYFFVGPAKTLVLNNTGVDYNRAIKVYVNGTESAITSIGKSSESNHIITISGLKDNDNNMIAIVSNQNGGDGGFTMFTYTANPQHHIIYKVNGAAAKEEDVYEGYDLSFPTDPADIEGKKFQGWKEGEAIVGVQETAPTFVNTTNLKATAAKTYHAVFAEAANTYSVIDSDAELTTGNYIIEAYDGTNDYAMGNNLSSNKIAKTEITIVNDELIENPAAELIWTINRSGSNITLYNADAEKYLTISSSANSMSLTDDPCNLTYSITDNGTGKLHSWIIKNGTRQLEYYASQNAFTVYTNQDKKIYLYKQDVTDYCTSPLPQVSMTVSATELADYVNNTNSTLTISGMQGDYEGTVIVASNNEEVATTELDGNTIKIKGISAGKARITVTAPATAKYSKKIAYIDVTISEKLAHSLSFDATELRLIVGATEIDEPKLSNKNKLPIVYSLVYATPANEGKVATIDAETGKITLAGLSTETQGAVTVKASTVGDYSHVAGEVTYNLVVARKVTTTSWSNGGAAVSIDQDDIAGLPSASNNGGLAITYTSSNKNAAKFVDGVLTFVGYGTTTITAATEANEEYAATSASYELTFAPCYTVTFKVFDQDDVVLREETSGAGVTAPAVSSMGSKVFRGWAEKEIDGTTDIAPTFVTTANLDGNKILYAVFATQTQSSSEGSSTLTADAIAENIMAKKMAYSDAERSYDDGTITWAVRGYAETDKSSYIQIKKDAGTYIKIAAPGAISNVSFDITTAANANFTGGIYLTTSPTGEPANDSNVKGSVNLSAKKTGTISTISGSNNTLYIQVGSAARLFNIAVTYGTPAVYSDYCTSFTSESITLTDPTEGYYGFSTFCGSANYTVEGAKAYKASVVSGDLVLTELTGIIPAGNSKFENGVVIAGTPGKTATIHYTTKEATADMSGNQLLGTLAMTPTETLKNGADYLMVFSKSNGGFVSYTGAYVPAYKACLPYHNDNASAPMRMVFGRDNLPTNNVNVNVNDNLGTKVMIDGRLYILRDGKTYDSLGRLVK